MFVDLGGNPNFLQTDFDFLTDVFILPHLHFDTILLINFLYWSEYNDQDTIQWDGSIFSIENVLNIFSVYIQVWESRCDSAATGETWWYMWLSGIQVSKTWLKHIEGLNICLFCVWTISTILPQFVFFTFFFNFIWTWIHSIRLSTNEFSRRARVDAKGSWLRGLRWKDQIKYDKYICRSQ